MPVRCDEIFADFGQYLRAVRGVSVYIDDKAR